MFPGASQFPGLADSQATDWRSGHSAEPAGAQPASGGMVRCLCHGTGRGACEHRASAITDTRLGAQTARSRRRQPRWRTIWGERTAQRLLASLVKRPDGVGLDVKEQRLRDLEYLRDSNIALTDLEARRAVDVDFAGRYSNLTLISAIIAGVIGLVVTILGVVISQNRDPQWEWIAAASAVVGVGGAAIGLYFGQRPQGRRDRD